jgi:predicted DNA-binding protein
MPTKQKRTTRVREAIMSERIVVSITQEMGDRLRALSAKSGAPYSEVVRRAINEFLTKQGV